MVGFSFLYLPLLITLSFAVIYIILEIILTILTRKKGINKSEDTVYMTTLTSKKNSNNKNNMTVEQYEKYLILFTVISVMGLLVIFIKILGMF